MINIHKDRCLLISVHYMFAQDCDPGSSESDSESGVCIRFKGSRPGTFSGHLPRLFWTLSASLDHAISVRYQIIFSFTVGRQDRE